VQFIRWLVTVFQGLQANVSDVAVATSQVAALWAQPTGADGIDFTDSIERINGQLAALMARPDNSTDLDPSAAIDLIAGEFAVLYARPDNSTDLDPSAALDTLNGQVSVLMGRVSEDTDLPPVGPGAGTYTVGLKLTSGGSNGQITIDSQGRITAITPAT
jgi:hypothetical protein